MTLLKLRVVDAGAVERAHDLAPALAELAHMPNPRRAERFQTLAADLFAIASLCDGPSGAELAQRVVDEDGFAQKLSRELASL